MLLRSTLDHVYHQLNTLLLQPSLDLFFPALCFICDNRLEKNRKIICSNCFRQIPVYEPAVAEPFADKKFNTAYILFQFNRSVRLLIHLLKYKGYLTLAEYFADATLQTFPQLLDTHYDYIIPVPLHPTRLRERGFNQSAILGMALGKKMGVPVHEEILIRRRNTPSQTRLNRQQRMQNVADAFHCHGLPTDARILIIDDVITTASTINACSLSLRRAGAAQIDALALANPVFNASPNLSRSEKII